MIFYLGVRMLDCILRITLVFSASSESRLYLVSDFQLLLRNYWPAKDVGTKPDNHLTHQH